jgi:hypothetical protein
VNWQVFSQSSVSDFFLPSTVTNPESFELGIVRQKLLQSNQGLALSSEGPQLEDDKVDD